MTRKQLLDYTAYIAVRCVICLIQMLSLQASASVARWLAYVACDLLRLRKQVVKENLRHAYPGLDKYAERKIVRGMWEHLFLMMFEIAHSPRKIHLTNWNQYINPVNKRLLVKYLLDDRPTVLLAGHYGNFEFAGYLTCLFGFPLTTVARPLDNPYLHEYVNRWRSSTGQRMLPKVGSAPQVQELLDSGGTLAILGDQNAGPKGCWVDFMNRPASCHKAIALFTLSSNAPMLVVSARRTGGPFMFDIETVDCLDPDSCDPSLLGVRPLTQWYNRHLEDIINQLPDQYWWVHRRWKKPSARVQRHLERQRMKSAA
jgi:KDO2-lipid IV(A) lauroyltransferase